MKRILAFLASLLIPILTPFMYSSPTAYASSLPSSPSYSSYITSSWGNNVSFNGQNVLYAYQLGYQATPGTSSALILDFGRQAYTNSVWGVNLPDGYNTYETDTWVSNVAQAYLNGYNDGHPNNTCRIGIGTNNDDYPWVSNSTNWNLAGTIWGSLVNQLSEPTYTIIMGANDFESWYSGGSWAASGWGATQWLSGYDTYTSRLCMNFGSEAYNEDSSAWTQQQVYQVSYGDTNAIVWPEIYVYNQQGEWATLRNSYYIDFSGVTSEDGLSGTYTWQQSWNNFYNALGSNSANLESSVTIF